MNRTLNKSELFDVIVLTNQNKRNKKNPKPKRQPRIKENPKKEIKSPMYLGLTKTQSRKPKKN
jgi:hypothetical protein